MKILLTGRPKSGKTTLLEKLLKDIKNKHGMVATEALEDGARIGFDLQDDCRRTAVLARTDRKTDAAVGRYYVDIPSLNAFIEPLFNIAPGQLLYIDEIGHMQLYSEKFQKLVRSYLDAPNDYLGTISSIYEHTLIDEVKSRSDILLCTITPDNRIHNLNQVDCGSIATTKKPLAVILRITNHIVKLPAALPCGYSHLDFDMGNILVDEQNNLSAILDFDDLQYAPLVICFGLCYSGLQVQLIS